MSKKQTKNWSREEHILAFNLYCKISFGTIHERNPKIIELGKLLHRSAGAVSYKLANFARLDPELRARGIKGMSHGAKGEAEVWNEFYEDGEALAFESEELLAQFRGQKLEQVAGIELSDLPKEGIERERLVRVRVNQRFFRDSILAAYDNRCCITGLALPELLVASHIVPWSRDKKNRMNPRNGLCLNALHDRAFDRGILVVAPDGRVLFNEISRNAKDSAKTGADWLSQFHGQPIRLPRKFRPDAEFLASHRKMWGWI